MYRNIARYNKQLNLHSIIFTYIPPSNSWQAAPAQNLICAAPLPTCLIMVVCSIMCFSNIRSRYLITWQSLDRREPKNHPEPGKTRVKLENIKANMRWEVLQLYS